MDIYAPMIFGWAGSQGLQANDAADVTQEVLAAVCRSIDSWQRDSSRPPFRVWLWSVCRNKIIDFWRTEKRVQRGTGDTAALERLHQLEDDDENLQQEWDETYQGQLLTRALKSLRPVFAESTWRAFDRLVIDGIPAKQVADELGLSLNAVYVAKSRVMGSLRQEIDGLMETRST